MNNSDMFGIAVTPQAKIPSKASPMLTGRAPAIRSEVASQVKLFLPCDAANWLLAELDYDDVAFRLCDLGQAFSKPWVRCH